MAKVLFIQANYDIDHLGELTPWMNVALVELATFIKEKNHEVKILDSKLENYVGIGFYPRTKKEEEIIKLKLAK